MVKIRVYELAKELGENSKDIVTKLHDLNITVKNHMSSISTEEAEKLKQSLGKKQEDTSIKAAPKQTKGGANKNQSGKKGDKKISNNTAKSPEETEKFIEISPNITVQELADAINKSSAEVIKKLMLLGVMATINQEVDVDTASLVASEFGYDVKVKEIKEEDLIPEEVDNPEDLEERPPVVTVMGHVDHGKTSLLDAIRSARVTAKEAGGITQHIGAYQVQANDKKITFIDTPGHEAFTAMRARGAQSTDIAILVVAADDGVMPQTIEAINHAKAAEVPIIVAINKMDKPEANPDRVKQELTEHGLVAEEWGGETICVPVSAKSHEGIDDLLEMILLVAEVEELKANPNRLATGVVVEAKLDKGRGPVATVIVQRGTLNVGHILVAGLSYGKVRAMMDHAGKRVKNAGPSYPVEVLGLSDVPEAGETFTVFSEEKIARSIVEKKIHIKKEEIQKRKSSVSLDDLFKQVGEGNIKDLNIIIKGDVQGSVEALRQSLEKLDTDEVRVSIIHTGVGNITETDVMLATASSAIIIGFNVRPDANTRKAAEKESIDIRLYRVIYDAIEDVKKAMSGLLDPDIKEVVQGRAQVRATFKVPKAGTIAGCYVIDGKITNSSKVRVIRDGVVIHESDIDSLKRFKDDAKEVVQGYECGIGVENFNDIKEGDEIEAYTFEEVKREL
ncbi:translation initiation factor IF-2 [Desulfitispora alkaliphila]|uniref:translation initiation factor IF-2 n=1 Tax=Desulfitispora alkaliphila TaxID=622674 RepID=UPI003D19C3A1